MDTELVRTFLEIVATGSFIRAAERLNVAQTTVSARIPTLEERLGRPLFVRHKGGASLTPAGEQFLRYAPTFVQLWQRCPPGGGSARPSIADHWRRGQPMAAICARLGVLDARALPDVALRVHIDVPQDLINQVAGGLVDAAIMYAPQHRPGLKIDRLMEEKLVLVTTNLEGVHPGQTMCTWIGGRILRFTMGWIFQNPRLASLSISAPSGLATFFRKVGPGTLGCEKSIHI